LGRSTANRFLDHPDDLRKREWLRAYLISCRANKARSRDRVVLSLTAGKHPGWLTELEDRTNSLFWKFDSVNAWGKVVGVDVTVHPKLNPVLDEELIGPLARTGVRQSAFSAIGLLEYCRTWREYVGISLKDLEQVLDINHGSLYNIEQSSNPRISTMQKYIRAMGGELEFHIEPIVFKSEKDPF
jgi:hypothetical protein